MASDGNGGSRNVGRFELVGELHKGMLGPLWLGHATSGDDAGSLVFVRRVEVGGEVDDAALQGLADQQASATALSHPNLLRTVEVVRSGSELAIVSEYQKAETVRSLLRLAGIGRKPVPPGVAARMAIDVLESCVLIHDAGALAALTPDNVFVGSDGVTRVIEPFFSQTAAADPAWKQQAKRATYSAPEQLGEEPGDARSDVFSLGVMMWEMLRNRPLFGGSNFEQIAERVRNAAIGRADALKPAGGEAVPKPLADIVEKALARDVGKRFESAVEMLEALEGCNPGTVDDVAKYAREILGEAFATLERKAGAVKPSAAPAARPAPQPKAPAKPAAPAGTKPQLPPRTPKATMQIDPDDLISAAPISSKFPDDEEPAPPPSDPAPAPAPKPAREAAAVEATPAPAPWTAAGRAGAAGRRKEAKRTLIGMAAPGAARPSEPAPAPEEEETGGADVDVDLGADEPRAAEAAAAPASKGSAGFDVMSIADDPSNPDSMDEHAAAALERVRKSQAPASSPRPESAATSPTAPKFQTVAVAESSYGKGKLIAIGVGAAVLLAAAAAFFLGGSKGGGEAAPSATATAAPAVTATAATTAMASAATTATATAAPSTTTAADVAPPASATVAPTVEATAAPASTPAVPPPGVAPPPPAAPAQPASPATPYDAPARPAPKAPAYQPKKQSYVPDGL
ncbi:MAG: protein kinase [Deltaproteobacteria bacterium]|nr:protein kinase [Deltaproteobacteria bacterium]